VLRNAVRETMMDPEFLKAAKKLDIDIEPMSAGETKKTVDQLFATPPAVVARSEVALAR
jgi:hypothetical protein